MRVRLIEMKQMRNVEPQANEEKIDVEIEKKMFEIYEDVMMLQIFLLGTDEFEKLRSDTKMETGDKICHMRALAAHLSKSSPSG